MKLNKIIFILFIILILLSISSVNAQDNQTDSDAVGLNENNEVYVDTHGLDSHDGSQNSPVRTIKKTIIKTDKK